MMCVTIKTWISLLCCCFILKAEGAPRRPRAFRMPCNEDLPRECKSSDWDVEHAEYKENTICGTITKETRRTYSCKHPYVMSIPDGVEFSCKDRRDGDGYKWRARRDSKLYLVNVTCELKMKCADPGIPPNMVRTEGNRYTWQGAILKYHNYTEETFYTGETLDYECKAGYEKPSDDISSMYGNYDDNYDTTITVTETPPATETSSITCDERGKWNGIGLTDLNFGTCEEIKCKASRFAQIKNGNITNYTEIYTDMEEMRLSCDHGYQPIDDLYSVTCLQSSSFGENDLPTFGCEAIRCPVPAIPQNGFRSYESTRVGSNVTFYCEGGYDLIGRDVWTCQENGEWDSSCILCDRGDTYCRPPCIPTGAEMTSDVFDFVEGSVILFSCTGGTVYGGSTNRTCMRNRQWSGSEIDCTGDSVFDVNVAAGLKLAMSHIANKTANETDPNKAQSRTINVGRQEGVDVYILFDVSFSITSAKKFRAIKHFINALLPELGINSATSGTRLALTTFASTTNRIFNQHYGLDQVFESYEEAQQIIDSITKKSLPKKIGQGTAIADALYDVKLDVETKAFMPDIDREAQQVVILLSDGRYTTSGNPLGMAEKLKELKVEIYSIAVGKKGDGSGFETMKEIASDIAGEEHFFAIDSKTETFDEVLKQMIAGNVGNIACGSTKPHKTQYTDNTLRHEIDAKANAWPWMAQLRNGAEHICGGSLVDKQWILTAAHCFDTKTVTKVYLRLNNLKEVNNAKVFQVVASKDSKDTVFIHGNYNPDVEPNHLYDIALVRLPTEVSFNVELHPVCLWDDTDMNEHDYERLFGDTTYGVVTGWGKSDEEAVTEDLKQMQMQIQPNDKCVRNLTDDQKKGVDLNVMFCAGGEDKINGETKIIDACTGDSGGPFVVQNPVKPNHFIQTGVVSFGFGCKKKDKYGFYTRLTPEIVKWIRKTINDAA